MIMETSMKRIPRHHIAGFEILQGNDLQSDKSLEHAKQFAAVERAVCDQLFAAFTRLDGKIEGRDLAPVGIPIERLQPLFHIFHVIEIAHGTSVPDSESEMQICSRKRGQPWM